MKFLKREVAFCGIHKSLGSKDCPLEEERRVAAVLSEPVYSLVVAALPTIH